MTAAVEPLNYHQDAKPLLDRYCTACHTAGGIAPFSLTDYAAAQTHAAAIEQSVKSGRMPPWLASDNGVPLRYSRAMRPADKDALLAWVRDGAQEGRAGSTQRITPPPAEMPAAPRRDLVLDMGLTYQPNTQVSDDYRCFIIDPAGPAGGGMPEERYVQATQVFPGNAALVHHVILFEVPAGKVASLRQRDDAEPGPGYTCFGGAGSSSAEMVTGWAPGGVPNRIQPDMGLRIRKGSVFVMQVHYNLQKYQGQGDRTTVELELASTPPPYRLMLAPIANPDGLSIKAGDAEAEQTIPVPGQLLMQYLRIPEVVITSVTPHMHTLGTSTTTTVDGQTLVELPRWDFHWQQAYMFQSPVAVRSNQLIMVTCTWDNSYANQPVVNGQKQMPRDVSWGEGTLDEMCVTFLGLRIPRVMSP